MTKRICLLALGVVAFTLPLVAGSGALSVGKPDDLGFAPDRMPRIREAVQRHVDAGQVSGAVTLVARRGKIAHFESYGVQDLETKKAMPKDGIFRLASMSKPITAVAVMMMIEEGKIRLTDPVSRFIPEFRGAKVAVAKPGARGGAPAGPGGPGGGPPRPRPPPPAGAAAAPGFGTATFMPLNSGMKRDTGSVSRTLPSSTIISTAAAVIGLDVDARRKMPSFGIGFLDSTSIKPCASR